MPKTRNKEYSTESNSSAKNVCVTCSTETECENVFHLTFENVLFNKIFKSCMGIQLYDNSNLKYICLVCIETIISFYTFKETALKSYEELSKKKIGKGISKTAENDPICTTEENDQVCTMEENDQVCTVEESDPLENSNNLNHEDNREFISIEGSNVVESIESKSNNELEVETDFKIEFKEESEMTLQPISKINIKDDNLWKCTYCPLTLSKDNPAEIKKHRYAEKIKRIKIYPCPVCKKKFTKSIIGEHILRHGEQKPSICEICGKGVSSNQTLKQHMMLHEGKKYVCNVCKKGFTQQFLLKEHMNIHERDKRFLCPTCGLSFLSPTNLRHHQYKHKKKLTQTKPELYEESIVFTRHICDFCGKNFSSTKTLAVHRATHDNKELFECDRCGKKFAHRALLTSHIWLHIAEFRCLKCFKIYKKDDLKIHKCHPPPEGKVFDEFLPNECRECGEILQHGHVDRHMKRHEARECKVCGAKIVGARKFQFHINGHKLRCDLCDKGFAKKDSFILHVKNRVCERGKTFKKLS